MQDTNSIIGLPTYGTMYTTSQQSIKLPVGENDTTKLSSISGTVQNGKEMLNQLQHNILLYMLYYLSLAYPTLHPHHNYIHKELHRLRTTENHDYIRISVLEDNNIYYYIQHVQ